MDRRTLFKAAALAGVGAAGAAVGASSIAAAAPGSGSAGSSGNSAGGVSRGAAVYERLVPEIFAPIPDAPPHTPVVIIGSGFGGAVAAHRLTQAGVEVTMLERGSRWPNFHPTRQFFSNDMVPDGRAFWRQKSFTGVNGIPLPADYFGGVLDVVSFNGLKVWRAAGVGGGSIDYSGAHPLPSEKAFQHVFGNLVGYNEMVSKWYPQVTKTLGASLMPDDIYNSAPYAHSRVWDRQMRKAGYEPVKIPGIWNWDIMRQELRGDVRRSAIIAQTNYGNANGVKRGLGLNYLKFAENTGKLNIFPGHEVLDIGVDSNGRYTIHVQKVRPDGEIVNTRTISCDKLFLSAGSLGTTELLMRAQRDGSLKDLNEHVGRGWGSNGDAAVVRSMSMPEFITQGAASASMVQTDVDGMHVTLENWCVPGVSADVGIIGSLGMTLDDKRADFGLSPDGKLTLDWSQPDSQRVLETINKEVADANGVLTGAPIFSESANMGFTAHPLGGAVLGKVTDGYGRVKGHKGLYVVDGSMIPGNSGAVNPVITITALAERNMENIVGNDL